MTTAQIDAFLAQIGYMPLASLDDLPTQVCAQCDRPKIRGLFTPLQLKDPQPRCRACIGECSQKQRKQYTARSPKESLRFHVQKGFRHGEDKF
jgi:hypothetical protein